MNPNRVLVVDVGGTHVKLLATGETEPRRFDSGPALLPKRMVHETLKIADGWSYDVVSVGYPGAVLRNLPVSEPYNLGRGCVGFDFEKAFERPVKVINDAAMQALGSYKGGKMLFLGLGTGLGSANMARRLLRGGHDCVVFDSSRGEADYQDKLSSAMRYQFGGHIEKPSGKQAA
jgi:predicted NBD/HSP70 family sugar kinase